MNKGFSISKIIEFVAVIIFLTAIIWVRAYKLDADPPIGLSSSSDVYTDPPNLTLYAKQKINFDEFTPLGDTRFVFFLKSSITALALGIFKLNGTGVISSNLVGLFFSLGALILFFLIVRKTADPLAGIFYLLLIGLNYNQLFYGRLPFQEHAMAFWGFLAFVLLLYSDNKIITLFAGISLGLGIFFGKIIGIAFLFPFAFYFIYRIFFEKNNRQKIHFVYFAIGLSLLSAIWFFYAYLPMKTEVGSYIGEHVYSLYGFPEGLKSIDKFINKFLTFGLNSLLFNRMKTASLFGSFFLGMIFFRLLVPKNQKDTNAQYNSGHIFIAALLIGFFMFLMVWNHRPLRYELVLIYSYCAGAAIVFSTFWKKRKKLIPKNVPFRIYYFLLPVVAIPFYQLYREFINLKPRSFVYEEHKYIVFLGIIIITGIIFIIVKLYNMGKIPRIPFLGKIVIIFSLSLTLSISWNQYRYGAERFTFCASDNSLDLKVILNPDAVITGPFCSTLTLENNHKSIIHMFGVSNPNAEFFKEFPITHLLVDKGNENRAFKDYPEMMANSTHILSYHIGKKKVRLYRISGNTGNPIADKYQPSIFEQLVEQYNKESGIINKQLAIEFLTQYPDNFTCYSFLGEAAYREKEFELAEIMFKKAVEFSPTNYDLTGRLAIFYHDRFNETNLLEYKEKGLFYYDMAIWVSPVTSGLKVARHKLREAK